MVATLRGMARSRLAIIIDSLLELSRPAAALNLAETVIEHPVSRAVELIHAHPEFQKVSVNIASGGVHDAMCDSKKMERVFYNLLLNSCQSVQSQESRPGRTVMRITLPCVNGGRAEET